MNDHVRGDWMQTADAGKFWPRDPRPEDIDIEVIAQALSNQCRFGGHSARFYSVAEHSVLLSRAVSAPNQLWALLHDAAEAYLGDVMRPIKPLLPEYRQLEFHVLAAIARRFNLPVGFDGLVPAEVVEADERILGDERRALMPSAHPWSTDRLTPLGVMIAGWEPSRAKFEFLARFDALSRGAAA